VAGRAAATPFPRAELVEVENAGHTPTPTPQGAQLAMQFLARPRD
jgi:hypothetical protein